MPALLLVAVDTGHSGVARVRTGPELSDLFLFALAVVTVALVRRALRRRHRRD
jgi:membrane protein implicated in regulation of membrane protease activity